MQDNIEAKIDVSVQEDVSFLLQPEGEQEDHLK